MPRPTSTATVEQTCWWVGRSSGRCRWPDVDRIGDLRVVEGPDPSGQPALAREQLPVGSTNSRRDQRDGHRRLRRRRFRRSCHEHDGRRCRRPRRLAPAVGSPDHLRFSVRPDPSRKQRDPGVCARWSSAGGRRVFRVDARRRGLRSRPPGRPAIGASTWRGFRGAVVVLYGSAAGLASGGAQTSDPGWVGVPGTGAEWDEFGHSLAAGPLAGGRYASLAIGVPGDGSTSGPGGTGAVNVLYGSAAGLTARCGSMDTGHPGGSRGARNGTAGSAGACGGTSPGRSGRGPRGRRHPTIAMTAGTGINVIRGSQHRSDGPRRPAVDGAVTRAQRRKYLDHFAGGLRSAIRRDRGRSVRRLVITADRSASAAGSRHRRWSLVALRISEGSDGEPRQVWRLDSPGVKGNRRGSTATVCRATTRARYGKSSDDDLAVAERADGAQGDRHEL